MKTLLNIDELSTEQKLGMLMCARYFHPNDKENLEIHLIGKLQTNKVKYIIDKVDLMLF